MPRGGKGLIERISAESPGARDQASARRLSYLHRRQRGHRQGDRVAYNAKTQRYGTCNTMETLLVAENIAARVLPPLAERYAQAGVELRGCERTRSILPDIHAGHRG